MLRTLALGTAALLAPLTARPARPQELKPGESARIPGVPFDELARRANGAAEGGRLAEAVRFYRAGLELNPLWAEGWWRLALIRFDAERYEDARTRSGTS